MPSMIKLPVEILKKHYNSSVDTLRILAILAVITIHTTTRTLEAGKYDLGKFPFTYLFHELASFAVPLFFLISGFVLELTYKETLDYKTYIKKRASRIVLPFLFWSIFYYLMFPMTQIPNTSFLHILVSGSASYQLYFIPTIIIFYSLFPFFHNFYNFLSKKVVIIPLILLQITLLSVDYYIKPFRIETPLRMSLLYFVIFLIGMIASHHEKKIITFAARHKMLLIVTTFILGLILVEESFNLYTFSKNTGAFYSQHRPVVFIYTLVIAALFSKAFDFLKKYEKYILLFSKLSFLVFFIHIAILYLFWYTIGLKLFNALKETMGGRIVYDAVFFFFVTGISFGIAYLVHKIPKLKLLTG